MSTPSSPLHDKAQQDIALLAFGEPIEDSLAEHVATCPQCQVDLRSYRRIVSVARDSQRDLEPAESDSDASLAAVWERIAAATSAVDDQAGGYMANAKPGVAGTPGRADRDTPPEPTSMPSRTRRWTRPLLAAATVVAIAGAGITGWSLGHHNSGTATTAGRAALAAQPGTPSQAHGTATMHSSSDGYRMTVATTALPAWDGYYEVWMYNPSANRMVAIGTLGTVGQGTFTLPAGIDVSAYHVIDVSAQKFDGNPAHERSVLRGPIT